MSRLAGPGAARIAIGTLLFSLNPTLFTLVSAGSAEIFWTVNVCATVTVAAAVSLRGGWPVVRRALRSDGLRLAAVAGVFTANNLLYIQAIRTTTVANSVLTHYLAPLIVFVVGAVTLGERWTRRGSISLVLGFGGILILVYPALAAGDDRHLIGMALGTASAAFYAGEIVLKKMLVARLPTLPVVLMQMAGSVVMAGPLVSASVVTRLGTTDMLILTGSGVFIAGAGVLLFTSGLRSVQAQQASIISYIEPVGAIVFGGLILGQSLPAATIVSAACVLGSLYLAIGAPSHRLDRLAP